MNNEGYLNWIQDYLSIVNKEGKLVPFVPNNIQRKFLTEDMMGRDIILKARQQGFTSIVTAIFLADFLMKENTYNVIIADDNDNATGILKRVKDYLGYWCDKKGYVEKDILKYNSKYELYFEAMNSTYHIGTAQNIKFGRSRTITNLHLSEGAFYPDLNSILSGALQAVVPTGRVILETTANGFNDFKTYWDDTVLGKTTFTPHFYKASDFYSPEFLESKVRELRRVSDGGTYEQEYPETANEAFINSGQLFFSREALKYYDSFTSDRSPLRSTYA